VERSIVLIGFMGTGKTAVGQRLAARLGRPFIDTDALVEARAGRPITRIFQEDGEEVFRRLEAEAVAESCARPGAVIATGGGAVLRPENMRRLRQAGVVVALRAEPEAILARVGAGEDRPLLAADPDARMRRLLAERDVLYSQSDLTVDTTSLSVDAVCDAVLAFIDTQTGYARAARDPRTASRARRIGTQDRRTPVPDRVVRVPLGDRGYDIRIGQALLPRIAGCLRERGLTGRVALLTHPALFARYGRGVVASLRDAGYEVATVTVRPSESSKSLRVVERVYDALVEAGLDRGAALLALGGGVAGDLGGFVAATFLRGIAWVAIPTTLLAQVDAGIGGKTGVNHPRAKNLIGAVHQPALVLSDIDTLRSLPLRQVRSGMAEVIKTGLIGAPDLVEYLEAHIRAALARRPEVLAYVVSRCAEYKAEIVAGDEREAGGRAVLNYGHTIGHGIEAASGYRGLTHGEAIAVGMTLEARLAARLGICDEALLERQTRLLQAARLPTRLGQVRGGRPPAPAAVLAAMAHDKKARAGRLRFVLPAALGRTVITDDVPAPLLQEVLADG
jgi:shikimate kinase/3-dehydroquinate synthase